MLHNAAHITKIYLPLHHQRKKPAMPIECSPTRDNRKTVKDTTLKKNQQKIIGTHQRLQSLQFETKETEKRKRFCKHLKYKVKLYIIKPGKSSKSLSLRNHYKNEASYVRT